MDKTELGRSVARQVNRIALSVFPFADGVATFDERRSAIPLEYMVSLSMHRLLHDGIKPMTSEPLVQAGLGPPRPARAAGARWRRFAFDPDDATPEELEILEHAQRKVTLRRLAWVPGGLAFPRLRAAYALLASGLLVDADQAEDGDAARRSRWRRGCSCSPRCSASPIPARRRRCAARSRTSWSAPRTSTARPG